jgi:hypothetical protein
MVLLLSPQNSRLGIRRMKRGRKRSLMGEDTSLGLTRERANRLMSNIVETSIS